MMDYEPFSSTHGPTIVRTLHERLSSLQGRSLRDAFTLAQVQAVLEDTVWQYEPMASVRLEYVDSASLIAVYAVEGMMIDTVRVRLATPDVQTMVTYKEPKKGEQETD